MSINVTVTETPDVDLTISSSTGLNVGVGGQSHNTLVGLQGGVSNEYYHLSLDHYNKVLNQGLKHLIVLSTCMAYFTMNKHHPVNSRV